MISEHTTYCKTYRTRPGGRGKQEIGVQVDAVNVSQEKKAGIENAVNEFFERVKSLYEDDGIQKALDERMSYTVSKQDEDAMIVTPMNTKGNLVIHRGDELEDFISHLRDCFRNE